jgi:hypothetical protein
LIVRSLEGGAGRLRPRRFAVPASSFVLGLVIAGLFVTAAAADGASTRIVVEPPIARPGDEISIHGASLWTEATVTATLEGRAGAARMIGLATTGPNGALEMRTRLPDDLPAGVFVLVVTNGVGERVEVELVVEPAIPLIPIAAVGSAIVVAIAVGGSMLRRRASEGGRPAV